MDLERAALLQKVLNQTVDHHKVFGTSFALKKDDFKWEGSAGNLNINQPYFIASTTKLFTTALIMNLVADRKISLADEVRKYIDKSCLFGLHLYTGVDYSETLTVAQLLSHTTGLPDYFQGKQKKQKSLEKELIEGNDQNWSFEEAIERTKKIPPIFAPGKVGKAFYSDANFQLLGKIIETCTNKSFSENCEEIIFKPLGLTKTYVYQDANDQTPMKLFYKNKELMIPKAMTSFGPDGGIVSTSSDMLVFIESFFNGRLFPLMYLSQMQHWKRIFFPMKSGMGIHLFKLPWILNPFRKIPYFIGHSGLSGALAFYCPKENLYIVGTVNQVAYPDISFRTMIQLTLQTLKKE
jgi:D-alanyl-D-alanine carboxypeptidase